MGYVAAIDQGTTSSRCFLFDEQGQLTAFDQREHRQIFPQPGWVEHDPAEIWANVQAVIEACLAKAGISRQLVRAVGITNQRETAMLWDRATGEPVGNAIVWQDTRTASKLASYGDIDTFRAKTGLPLATYFSAPKLRWLLDATGRSDVLAGTMDSWLIYKLTGQHATDVTNASRTMLMDLSTLDWDDALLEAFGIPRDILPTIKPSIGSFGTITSGPLAGAEVSGVLGDQQAALFGQGCFEPGEAKCTYGTGAFLLLNTGNAPIASTKGLVTTVGYQREGEPAVYALEGSVAVAGALVQWLRDNLGIIKTASEVNDLASTVDDNGGCYIVPAFSGLFAPYWKPEARGVICGLTGYVTKAHLARAALEATAWQVHDVVEVMAQESGQRVAALNVDGGMTASSLLLQIQADLLGVPVVRPTITETTVLGAAYAAGLATGVWPSQEVLRGYWRADKRWEPELSTVDRQKAAAGWQAAVAKTLP